MEGGITKLIGKAEAMRQKMMDPNLTDAQKQKLQLELDALELASEDTFQATLGVANVDATGALQSQIAAIYAKLADPSLTAEERKRLHAEASHLEAACKASTERLQAVWTMYVLRRICIHNKSHNLPLILGLTDAYIFPFCRYKQAAHNVLRQARSMNALFAKSKRGKVDFATMQKSLVPTPGNIRHKIRQFATICGSIL